ncbi:hypothetical protein ABZZ20_05445 [Streptomyces sp. NPDC006430]|uniref:hypothetical protein n=1 Tax=Streptomyces sp. NPDC006430 TaxID=3154299 RepID=UPI0033B1BB32
MRAFRAVAAVLLSVVVLSGCGSGEPSAGPSSGAGTASAPAQPSAGATSGPATSSASPTAVPGPASTTVSSSGSVPSLAPSSALERLVTVTRTGGFAGRTSSLLVKGDGSWTRWDGEAEPTGSGKLSPDRLVRLRTALQQADFAHLPRVLEGGPTVYDGFRYAFVHGGHEVAAGQESLTPGLRSVLDALPPFDA